jgi:uncharacterized protein
VEVVNDMSDLVLDVRELVSRPGTTQEVRRDVTVTGLRSALGWIGENEALRLDLAADGVREGIAVSGRVSGTVHLSCSRCLVDFEQGFDQLVDETYYFEGADEIDGYEVQHSQIDLEPMLRDLIVLAFPIRPLHDENCLGLCTTCGADRNAADCGHTQDPVDLRWAPLQGALARLERSS